jgi:quercetin dioxygenase-like cupin family protein
MKISIIAFVLMALAFNYSAADAQMQHKLLTPKTLKWADAPPGVPKGAKIAVLAGDPMGQGLFTIRLKFPAGYMIPAHSHPTDEFITVIAGTLKMGVGDKFDTKELKTMPVGGFSITPAKSNHYVTAEGETIVQITSTAPFQINYVNPADDPRK